MNVLKRKMSIHSIVMKIRIYFLVSLLFITCLGTMGKAEVLCHYINGQDNRTNVITSNPGMDYPPLDELGTVGHLGDFVLTAGDLPPVPGGVGANWMQWQNFLIGPTPDPNGSFAYFDVSLKAADGLTLDLESLTFNWGAFVTVPSTQYSSRFIYAVYAENGIGNWSLLGGGEQFAAIPSGTSQGYYDFKESVSFDLSGFSLLQDKNSVKLRCTFANNTTAAEETLLVSNIIVNGSVQIPEPTLALLGFVGLGFYSVQRRRIE